MDERMLRATNHAAVWLGLLLLILSTASWTPAFARSAGPFRPLLGHWSGPGTISTRNGHRESIRCRAITEIGDTDDSFAQSLVCASDAFRLEIRSSATASGGILQGRWREATRSLEGALSGRVASGVYEGEVTGPGFSASLSIRGHARRQVVHLQPSAGDIRSVDINLSKSQ